MIYKSKNITLDVKSIEGISKDAFITSFSDKYEGNIETLWENVKHLCNGVDTVKQEHTEVDGSKDTENSSKESIDESKRLSKRATKRG